MQFRAGQMVCSARVGQSNIVRSKLDCCIRIRGQPKPHHPHPRAVHRSTETGWDFEPKLLRSTSGLHIHAIRDVLCSAKSDFLDPVVCLFRPSTRTMLPHGLSRRVRCVLEDCLLLQDGYHRGHDHGCLSWHHQALMESCSTQGDDRVYGIQYGIHLLGQQHHIPSGTFPLSIPHRFFPHNAPFIATTNLINKNIFCWIFCKAQSLLLLTQRPLCTDLSRTVYICTPHMHQPCLHDARRAYRNKHETSSGRKKPCSHVGKNKLRLLWCVHVYVLWWLWWSLMCADTYGGQRWEAWCSARKRSFVRCQQRWNYDTECVCLWVSVCMHAGNEGNSIDKQVREQRPDYVLEHVRMYLCMFVCMYTCFLFIKLVFIALWQRKGSTQNSSFFNICLPVCTYGNTCLSVRW
jgi:hypothetical protein